MRGPTGYVGALRGFGRDARLFLLTTLAFGAAGALYWTDFNLYLEALGLDRPTIGLLMAASQVAGVVATLPAGALSDRLGRRRVLGGALVLTVLATLGYLEGSLPALFLSAVVFGAGSQAWYVVQVPFMAEHTEREHRNEYFAIVFAIGNLTMLVAALVGGAAATAVAGRFGLTPSVGPYQVLLVAMAALTGLALVTVFGLTNDRPPAARVQAAGGTRFGIVVRDRDLFARLLLPGFLTALGAGQLIPFLNIFVKGKFGLDLTAVNAIFAVTSLGTMVAVLIQPALARRFGRIGSVVLVQGASIPFLVVLGFSPVLWMVIGAMTVRNSLMNAGGPIFDAFAMERVSAAERATLSAGMTLLWALGWAIAEPYYSLLQATLGFTAGYAIDFLTIVVLYSVATGLLWRWFRADDTALARAGVPPETERAAA